MDEVYSKGSVKLILGDCFELIKQIEDNSIDLIFTDPPYSNTEYYNRISYYRKEVLAREFKRVLKMTGNLVLFCGMYCKWDWYNVLSKLFKFHQELIWYYKNSSKIRCVTKRFVPSHETMLWFVKSDRFYFKQEIPFGFTVIEHPTYSGFMRGKDGLPNEKISATAKPLKVAEFIIERLCPKDGVVLDTFAGTGTFAIACMKLGRKYIGFEIDEKWFNLAKERIEKYATNSNIFSF